MYKNVANQHIAVFAWDGANGIPKTGDVANITAWVSKDGAALLGSDDLNPVEIGFGVYIFDVSQGESNCDLLVWAVESSTADVDIRPVIIYTQNLDGFKATGFSTHNAADVHDEVIEGALTSRQIQMLILSFIAGQTTGGGTNTVEFKNQAGGTSRIIMTVNEAGDRSAVVTDVT